MRGSTAGGVLRAQDFVANIHPPVEAPEDLQQAMDAIVKLEEVKRASADEAFADEKQKMVDAEKREIAEIVGRTPQYFEEALGATQGKRANTRLYLTSRPATSGCFFNPV